MDVDRNARAPRGQVAQISAHDSLVKIFIIPTNEELEIATQTVEVLS